MESLREEFKKLASKKFKGAELLFETSNSKYIEWLEGKVIKSYSIPDVGKRFTTVSDALGWLNRCGYSSKEIGSLPDEALILIANKLITLVK